MDWLRSIVHRNHYNHFGARPDNAHHMLDCLVPIQFKKAQNSVNTFLRICIRCNLYNHIKTTSFLTTNDFRHGKCRRSPWPEVWSIADIGFRELDIASGRNYIANNLLQQLCRNHILSRSGRSADSDSDVFSFLHQRQSFSEDSGNIQYGTYDGRRHIHRIVLSIVFTRINFQIKKCLIS